MSRLITIDHIGLANIVANEHIVQELLQDDANAHNISHEMFKLLNNQDYRQAVQQNLLKVKENLGMGDGARHMAELILSFV